MRTRRGMRAALPVLLLSAVCGAAYCDPAVVQIDRSMGRTFKSRYASKLVVGQSAEGRPIIGAAVSDPTVDHKAKTRVLVIAGQHGNEPNPSLAVSRLAAEWARGAEFDELRRQTAVVFVPVVNPDGFVRGTRADSTGTDLNRDWGRFSRPETRAVDHLIDVWKPHLLIDVHEWTDPRRNDPDAVELASDWPDPALQRTARQLRADTTAAGAASIDSLPGRSRHLFHRHYAAKGYAAYLVETAACTPAETKAQIYRTVISGLIRGASARRGQIETCSTAGQPYRLPPEIEQMYRIRQPERHGIPDGVTAAAAAGSGACVLLICGARRPRPSRWLRSLRRCSAADISVTFTPRGPVPDLTSRSWVNRRIRSGHRVSGRAAV